MRILYVGWADHVHLARWAERFAGMGHIVWVYSERDGKIPGVKLLKALAKNNKPNLQAKELSMYAKLLGAEIVHAHWAAFSYLPARAKIKPYVVTAWGSDIYGFERFSKVSQEMILAGLNGADLITVDSNDLKRAIVQLGIRDDKIEVVQWGVDTKIFRPGLDSKTMKAKLEINDNRVVYSPRGIGEIYNNDIVLHAFKKLLAKCPNTILVQKYYNCSEKDVSSFRELSVRLGVDKQVRLVGEISYSEVPTLYAIADMVVSVPSVDGTPMSVLEAMACGVVPVVSDLPSLREWIVHGENGFIVPPKDGDALAAGMAEVLHGDCVSAFKDINLNIVRERADHYGNMSLMEKRYQDLVSEIRG